MQKKIQKDFDKKRYNVILHDRTHLTDYERDQLIPELKSRLNVLKQYFCDIINLCDIQRESPVFTANINSIINPKGISSPSGENTESLSDKFFDDIKKQAQAENIDDIDRILKKYENIEDVKSLGMFINEVNFLCSSLLAVKNKLFLFKIEGYPYILDKTTGQVTPTQPQQYFLTTEPFQLAIDNIASVAKATSETIHEWHKQTMKLKSQYLDLYTNRISIRNNMLVLVIQILTIFLAVALSAFFLFANNPFNLFQRNQDLQRKIIKLEDENNLLKSKEIESQENSAIKIKK